MKLLLVLLVTAMLAPSLRAQAARQAAPTDSLYRTIAALDSAMFDAYNRCDLEKLANFFTDDLEFYHDQTGLGRGRHFVVEAVRNNICGKVRRDPMTLEVYPLRGYGAVATGVHRFCDARKFTVCGENGGPARFATIWQQTGATWKISRVISYDHQ